MSGLNGADRTRYSVIKTAYHWMRHLPDRVLHERRHVKACARLTRLRPVRSILVVCHGNVCRSPYLEAVLRRELSTVTVMSAGLVGPDRPVPKNSLKLAAQRGLDLSDFRSRPLSRTNARKMDLVIVMDVPQRDYLARVLGVSPARIIVAGDLDPIASPTRTIRDPWGKSLEVFGEAFDRLDRCAETILSFVLEPEHDPLGIVTLTRPSLGVR